MRCTSRRFFVTTLLRESTRLSVLWSVGFVLLVAIGAALVGGFFTWVIDVGTIAHSAELYNVLRIRRLMGSRMRDILEPLRHLVRLTLSNGIHNKVPLSPRSST